MKKESILTVFASFFVIFNSVGQINIQQVNSSEFLSTQSVQLESLDISSITQLGNYNTAHLIQTKKGDVFSFPNSSNSFQQGDFNLADVIQKGNENVLLSFQLGYLTNGLLTLYTYQPDAQLQNMLSFSTSSSLFTAGINNTLYSSQEGKSNEILVIQQGSSNYIDVEQLGNENLLIINQVGMNNRVENFKQNNIDGKIDVISQIGDNNTFNSVNGSIVNFYENNYTQEGSNLSLTINNSNLTSLGAIKVNQTGHDMNIVIDQSYFSYPMQ